jgi:hypothetical protein
MDSKYKILPVKIEKKVSEKWKDVDSHLPKHAFAILVSAPPRSGKTNLLVNMLINPNFDWINKFDKIVWLSPSILTDKTAKPILEIADDEDNPLSEKIKIVSGDDLDNVDEIIKLIIEDQDENPEQETLVILDDMLGKMKNNSFSRLYTRYRHKNISMLAISQMFKGFDTTCRACASGLILFKTHNAKEREKIIEELAGYPDAEDAFDEATSAKHSFLWVNNEQGELWKNFSEILYKK